MNGRCVRRIALALAILALPALAGAAPSGADLCRAAKLKFAAKYAKCQLKADSVYFKTVDQARRDEAQVKCKRIMQDGYDRAELHYGSDCPATGDVIDVYAYLTTCAQDANAVVQATPTPSPTPTPTPTPSPTPTPTDVPTPTPTDVPTPTPTDVPTPTPTDVPTPTPTDVPTSTPGVA